MVLIKKENMGIFGIPVSYERDTPVEPCGGPLDGHIDQAYVCTRGQAFAQRINTSADYFYTSLVAGCHPRGFLVESLRSFYTGLYPQIHFGHPTRDCIPRSDDEIPCRKTGVTLSPDAGVDRFIANKDALRPYRGTSPRP